MNHPDEGFLPDTAAVRAAYERVWQRVTEDNVLAARAADDLFERLDVMRLVPETIADLGAGTGRLRAPLRDRYPEAELIELDLSLAALRSGRPRPRGLLRRITGRTNTQTHAIAADAARLPLADHSVDLVVSNFALHCCDPRAVMPEIKRVLRPEGALLFSTLGPDTLREIDESWRHAGAEDRVVRFMDMHDLGDVMLASGLVDPVVDMDIVTLTYSEPAAIWRDLRAMGSRNIRRDRTRTLTGRQRFAAVESALRQRTGTDGLIRVTAELVYGNAWARPVSGAPCGPENSVNVVFGR